MPPQSRGFAQAEAGPVVLGGELRVLPVGAAASVLAALGAGHSRRRLRRRVARGALGKLNIGGPVVPDGLAGGKVSDYSGKVFVFWDLDNKIPERGVSVRACVESLRSMLAGASQSVETVNIYANTATLSLAFGKSKAGGTEALFDKETDDGIDDENTAKTCPVCGKALKGTVWSRRRKLNRHLEMHRQEHKKRQMMRQCIGRNLRSSQKASFQAWDVRFIEGREAILELLGNMAGVQMRASQSRAVTTIQEMAGTHMRPVPCRPQAADEELIYDLRAMVRSQCSHKGAGTLCLISDDGGYVKSLRNAWEAGWQVVTISARQTMIRLDFAERGVPWSRLMTKAREVKKPPPDAAPDVFFSKHPGSRDPK